METTIFKKLALTTEMLDAAQTSAHVANTFIHKNGALDYGVINLSGSILIDEAQLSDDIYPDYLGQQSIAIGPDAKALNKYTIAASKGQALGDHSVALCFGKTYGGYSVAYGNNTSSFGYASHAEGILTKTGENAHKADSYYKQMCGTASHVEGIGNSVFGNYAHAEGRVNEVYSDFGHVEGYHSRVGNRTYVVTDPERYALCGEIWYNANDNISNTISVDQIGRGAHAEGCECSSFGDFSHSEGVKAITLSTDSFSYTWNGVSSQQYSSNGSGTFNINPHSGIAGFYIGNTTLSNLLTDKNPLVYATEQVYLSDDMFTDNNINVVHIPENDKKLINSSGEIYLQDQDYKWYQVIMPFNMNIYGPAQNTLIAVYETQIDKQHFICRYRSWETFPTKNDPLLVKAGQILVICPKGNIGFSLHHDNVSLSSLYIKEPLLKNNAKKYSIMFDQKPFNNNSNDFEFYKIFQRTDDPSAYIRYDVVHNTTLSAKSNNWRLARVSQVDMFGTTICRIVNNPELNAAITIKQGSTTKFIGGAMHGYEKDVCFNMFIDNTPIFTPTDLSTRVEADQITFGAKTTYYNPFEDSVSNTKIGKHYIQYELKNGKVYAKQHITWLSAMEIGDSYMPMLGIANYNDYVNANKFESYDTEDDTCIITAHDLSVLPYSDTPYNYIISANTIDIFSTEHPIHSIMSITKQVKDQEFSHKMSVQNNATKTTAKVYNVICNNSTVNVNDTWETDATYEFRLK